MAAAPPAAQRYPGIPVRMLEVNHEVGEVVPELGTYILPGRIKDRWW
jgi:hypothetical protein